MLPSMSEDPTEKYIKKEAIMIMTSRIIAFIVMNDFMLDLA